MANRKNFKFEQMLRDDQWQKIDPALQEIIKNNYHQNTTRMFIDAVLWVVVNNTAWTYLPAKYGKSKSKYIRFHRWTKGKIWHALAQRLADDEELGRLLGRIVERGDLFAKANENRHSRRAEKHFLSAIPSKKSPYDITARPDPAPDRSH